MEKFKIDATATTPRVEFYPDTLVLVIEGISIPENIEGSDFFFNKIAKWLEAYSFADNKSLRADIRLSYYNTTSVKRIYDLLKRLDNLFQAGADIKIRWEHEDGDEDMKYDGESYKMHFKVPIEIVKV